MIRDESDGRTDGAEKYLIWGLICWVTCMCLLNTGVGTREALRARSQMKDLTVHGLGSALQRIKKVYVSHKYSQKELNRSLWREQLEYRLSLSSQKSVWGRFKDSQVPTLMPCTQVHRDVPGSTASSDLMMLITMFTKCLVQSESEATFIVSRVTLSQNQHDRTIRSYVDNYPVFSLWAFLTILTMLSTSSPCVVILSGRLGLFDFLLVPTIGLDIAFVALFEEQRAASAACWVGSHPCV